MSIYVNPRAMAEMFETLELQGKVMERVELIHQIEHTFAEYLVTAYERAAYDLKAEGWTLPQIADELNVTIPAVSGYIKAYQDRSGKPSLMPVRSFDGPVVDIRALVRREAAVPRPSAETTHPTA